MSDYDPRDDRYDPRDSEPDARPCPLCKGMRYIPRRGEPQLADACDCAREDFADDDGQPDEAQEWADFDPDC